MTVMAHSQTTIEPEKGKRTVCVCGSAGLQFVDEDRSRKILKERHIEFGPTQGPGSCKS
jgi:hypothetical protein